MGFGSTPIYPLLYWHLWKARNMLIFEDRPCTEAELVLKVLKDARAWEEASQTNKLSVTRLPCQALVRPSPSGLHCFTDGAWDPNSGNSGQGWVFFDPSVVELKHHSSNRRHVAAPIVAEALALNIFSDSKSLINLLNSSSSTVLLQSVLFDIRALSARFESVSFYFTPRLGNVVADSLAKAALSQFVISPGGE
uniref:RNase H type-1 domain-containing protein n=1 Tax=Brassica oleracea TaxID=3712 RepID=A0A3P6E1S6_BRAOL|nr:unnamed protein product [Brassica oleracea]